MAIRRAVSSLWASVTRAAPVASAFQLPFSAAGGVRSFAGSESAPAKPTLGAGVNGAAPSGPEPDSFISTGASKLTDTMYFRRLGAARSGKALSGAFTPNSFAGRVVLFVNTASLCGFTPQLRQMQSLYKRYNDVGLIVVAMPCNDFGEQEPWEESRIAAFYKEEYGVTYPVTGKVSIAKDRHSFFTYIGDEFGEPAVPTWNFHKVLVGRDGVVKAMFPPHMSPEDPQVIATVVRELEADTKDSV